MDHEITCNNIKYKVVAVVNSVDKSKKLFRIF